MIEYLSKSLKSEKMGVMKVYMTYEFQSTGGLSGIHRMPRQMMQESSADNDYTLPKTQHCGPFVSNGQYLTSAIGSRCCAKNI